MRPANRSQNEVTSAAESLALARGGNIENQPLEQGITRVHMANRSIVTNTTAACLKPNGHPFPSFANPNRDVPKTRHVYSGASSALFAKPNAGRATAAKSAELAPPSCASLPRRWCG